MVQCSSALLGIESVSRIRLLRLIHQALPISLLPDPFFMKLEQRIAPIQMILCDVDGVLTDGRISFDNQGIEIKSFHARDGMGIKLWQKAGGQFGLLTARTSHIVKVRAAELGVELVRQGFSDKLPIAQQIMQAHGLTPEQICYVGDDLTDLQIISHVGLGVAVADAATEVREAAAWVTNQPGGFGAVRELIELILKTQDRWTDVIRKFRGP